MQTRGEKELEAAMQRSKNLLTSHSKSRKERIEEKEEGWLLRSIETIGGDGHGISGAKTSKRWKRGNCRSGKAESPTIQAVRRSIRRGKFESISLQSGMKRN